MRGCLTTVLAVGAWLVAVPAAPAGFVFTFSNVGDIQTGQTHTVNVFLHWDGSGTNNLAAGNGLSEADFGIRLLQSSPGTVTVANPTGADVAGNNDFDFQQRNAPNNSGFSTVSGYTNLAGLQLGIIANSPVTTSGAGNTGGSVDTLYLGSFTLTAGPDAGPNPLGVTVRAFVRNTGTSDNFLDSNFTALDSQISPGDASFNVTPVPEPGSIALLGVAATGIAGAAWRKRRNPAPAIKAS